MIERSGLIRDGMDHDAPIPIMSAACATGRAVWKRLRRNTQIQAQKDPYSFLTIGKQQRVAMQRFKDINGGSLPFPDTAELLRIEHVLQRYRDVWVTIETYPFLALDLERVMAHCATVDDFPVFTNGRLMQNVRPDEGGSRLLSALMGGGINAGMVPEGKVVVDGVADPRAHWMMYFNDPFYIGMHPFVAHETHYVYVTRDNIYQRVFGELVTSDGNGRPRSTYVDFDPVAGLLRTFYDEYLRGPRDAPRAIGPLADLLDAMFVENEKILAAAARHHHDRAPLETAFDYEAPTLTRYGRLTHDPAGLPRIELSFALLHYVKALREFNKVKDAVKARDTETAFFHRGLLRGGGRRVPRGHRQ